MVTYIVLGLLWMGMQNTWAIDIHGHRGSRGTHPENTLPAFEEAAKCADAFETDLHLSRDGAVFLFHDPFISSKLCQNEDGSEINTPLFFGDLTAAEIAKYSCGDVPQPRFPDQVRLKNVKIPSLIDFLNWYKGNKHRQILNLEIKMDAPAPHHDPAIDTFVTAVLKPLREYHVLERSFIQSFDLGVIKKVRELAPTVTTSCLFEAGEKNIISRTKSLGSSWISPEKGFITAPFVKEAHEAGLKVVPWTLNTEQEWQNAIDSKVDAIISDYPKRLYDYLKAKGLKH